MIQYYTVLFQWDRNVQLRFSHLVSSLPDKFYVSLHASAHQLNYDWLVPWVRPTTSIHNYTLILVRSYWFVVMKIFKPCIKRPKGILPRLNMQRLVKTPMAYLQDKHGYRDVLEQCWTLYVIFPMSKSVICMTQDRYTHVPDLATEP